METTLLFFLFFIRRSLESILTLKKRERQISDTANGIAVKWGASRAGPRQPRIAVISPL